MSNIPDNILRDGTSQKVRYTSGLKADKVLVDGRDMEYFLRYVAKLAEKIRFYDRTNMPYGTWDLFFPKETEITQFLSNVDTKNNLSPQLALFIAFTKLMDILKSDINQLSRQHLKFYYEQVLRFQRQQAIAEKVNIVFEPAGNITEPIILPEGSELLAGKDTDGNPIIFTTDKECSISKVVVSKVSSIMVDEGNDSRVYASPKADSADGNGAALPKDAPYWNPFGESQVGKAVAERTMSDGKAGIAIASSMFLLKEGKRDLTITLDCRNCRFTELQFQALRTAGIPDVVMQQLQPVENNLYQSTDDFITAIKTAIGDANYILYEALITDHILHPLKLVKDADLEKAFVLQATGEKGWFPINNVIITKQANSQLRFQISIDVTDPAVVDFNPLLHKEPVDNTLPVIQLNLNHDNTVYLYDELRGLKIVNVILDVDVKGITSLVLQGDNGPVNPAQPFLPFGAVPSAGADFYFGSREIFSKKLDSLQLELSWANLPKDLQGFQDYYTQYPDIPTNDSFTAAFSILDKKKWIAAASQNVILFKTATVAVPAGSHMLYRDIFTIDLPLPVFDPSAIGEVSLFDQSATQGFGRLTLNEPDFKHDVFSKTYAEKAIIKATTNPLQVLPNPPYTPKISHFAVNYSASLSFVPSGVAADSNQLFHVEPFGMAPVNDETTGELLPQFAQGSLYIGIANLQPPQNISILFQMVDGSANPDIEVTRDDVKWSYLDETTWKELSDVSVQIDTTYGLQTSGVIEFSIPSNITNDAAFWPTGLYWLRADFSKDPSGASKVASIITNAMVATLRSDQVQTGVLSEPLQPGSISKLIVTDPAIKTVKQPFSSFGGKAIEPEIDFNRRVSERIRHKNRAVNLWDYEHLVLEAFSSIYKVKCLPHTGRGIEAEPGSVTLLVIPDLRKRNKINPFEPRVSTVIRNQIGDYMTNLKSGFSKIYVDNPKYEQVLVEMSVGLRPGYDGNFYGHLLNEELKKFLSPWAYEEGEDIVFGGKIFKSSILSFVEQREYVDYVTNFKLYQIDRGLGIGDMRVRDDLIESTQDFIVRPDTVGEEMDFEIIASSARSVLVTAPDHIITILNPGEFVCPEAGAATGIGAMIIEVDFFVF